MLSFLLPALLLSPVAAEGAARPLQTLLDEGAQTGIELHSMSCPDVPGPNVSPATALQRTTCARKSKEAAARYAASQVENPLLQFPTLLRPVLDDLQDVSPPATCTLLVAGAAEATPFDATTADRELWAELLTRGLKLCGAKPRHTFETYLYRDLGETAGARAFLQKAPRKLRNHGDRKLAIQRAHVLTKRHDNKEVFKTLERVAARPLGEDACEVRYLLGKAARKTRRYKRARKELGWVIKDCPDPWKKKSRFLLARVATYQGAKDAVAVLDSFFASYPDDSLSDDVLLWKAEYFAHRGKLKDADAVYALLLEKFPDGDMAKVARFDQAFLRAQGNDAAGARQALDQALREGAADEPLTHDQALYWRARLAVFPDLFSYTPAKDPKLVDEGVSQLLSLAEARPASFYGDMAKKTLRVALKTLKRDASQVEPRLAAAAPKKRRAPTKVWFAPTKIEKDPRFVRALALLHDKHRTAGRIVLDSIERAGLDPGSRTALALAYSAMDDLPRAHQVMRFSGSALLPHRPTGDADHLWGLAYPPAHRAAISAAAKERGVPTTLLMGLAREESAFDAEVTSWAGALGLCQLMPFTAKEEAERLKVKNPTREALFTPELNARLGAEHLARRIKGLGHPFLGIAAYNAGPGNVKKWRHKNAPLTVDAWVELIPVAQTRGYVKKVAGSWVVYSWLDEQKEIEYDMMLPAK